MQCFPNAVKGFKRGFPHPSFNSAEVCTTNIGKPTKDFLRKPFFFPILLNDLPNNNWIQNSTHPLSFYSVRKNDAPYEYICCQLNTNVLECIRFLRKRRLFTNMEKNLTGYPSIDKPWRKYYTDAAINSKIPECTIYEYLWQHSQNHMDEPALVYFGRTICYKELFENIERTTKAFLSIGVKSGDYVTICSVNVPEVVYSFYALNRIGAVSNMVDPRTNTDRIGQYMEAANSRIVLTLDKALPRFLKLSEEGKIDNIVILSPADSLPLPLRIGYKLKNKKVSWSDPNCQSWKTFISTDKEYSFTDFPYRKDYPVTVVYTGGTTGIPKGAVLSNDSLNALTVEYSTNGMDYSRGQKFLNIMPPFIAYGVSCGLNMPLCIGLTNILIPQFNPEQFGELLTKYRPEHFIGVPTHFEKLISGLKSDKLDLSFVKTAAAGGDALIPESEKRINKFFAEHGCRYEIIKGYGMTELGSAAATTKDGANKLGSIGVPLPKNNISVRDPETRVELPYNNEGEFYMSSPTMMSTYINAPEELANVFWIDENGVKWVKTGDIGYVDEDGFIFLKGRMKRMIIRPDGHNVWPSQIEAVIAQHPGVDQCAVVGLPVPGVLNGKTPTAFIVVKPGTEKTRQLLNDIEAFSKEHMPERDTASVFRFIDNIPMTPVGKVDYRALEETANM